MAAPRLPDLVPFPNPRKADDALHLLPHGFPVPRDASAIRVENGETSIEISNKTIQGGVDEPTGDEHGVECRWEQVRELHSWNRRNRGSSDRDLTNWSLEELWWWCYSEFLWRLRSQAYERHQHFGHVARLIPANFLISSPSTTVNTSRNKAKQKCCALIATEKIILLLKGQ